MFYDYFVLLDLHSATIFISNFMHKFSTYIEDIYEVFFKIFMYSGKQIPWCNLGFASLWCFYLTALTVRQGLLLFWMFYSKGGATSSKLLGQGYVMERLKSCLRKFYGRYWDLIDGIGRIIYSNLLARAQ